MQKILHMKFQKKRLIDYGRHLEFLRKRKKSLKVRYLDSLLSKKKIFEKKDGL
jgi:hypothetical protein